MKEKNQNNISVTIKNIKFNNDKEISFNDNDIVIFVGPNNVGKSRTLKDIRDDLIDSERKKTIIKKIDYNENNFNDKCIKKFFQENFSKNEHENYEVYIEPQNQYTYYKHNFENFQSNKKDFYKVFFTFLSTENRLGITKAISYNYINDFFAFNIMEKLQENLEEIKKLNDVLIFGFNKAIDVTEEREGAYIQKVYKIGNEQQIDLTINSNSRDAKQKLHELENLDEQGDGIRSAVAVLSSLIVGNQSIYLMDEPEAFLHPPQARLLGSKIVELSENKQCFISTHNIDLIRGVLEKKPSRVKIIKIEREDNKNKFFKLDNENITTIANDRNLKYTNILNGLFYDRVVLCENESDCKFYSAILETIDDYMYQKTLFCAVGGKDQFKIIIPLLESLKIKYLIIADIDIINDIDKLKQLLNSIDKNKYETIKEIHENFLTEYEEKIKLSSVKQQSIIKKEINNLFTEDKYMTDETAKKIKDILKNINSLKLLKSGGKAIIPQGECISNFNKIEKFLNMNNIFFLDCGEIERLIPEIDLHGNKWVEKAFKDYPDLNSDTYEQARDFIKKVFKLEENNERN